MADLVRLLVYVILASSKHGSFKVKLTGLTSLEYNLVQFLSRFFRKAKPFKSGFCGELDVIFGCFSLIRDPN